MDISLKLLMKTVNIFSIIKSSSKPFSRLNFHTKLVYKK